MTDLRDRYKATTLRILGKFQLLEFALKHYIGFSYQIIRERLDGEIHFSHTIEDVENHPLERLLTLFRKLNSDTELHGKLSKLVSKRNHIAHKALLVSWGTAETPAALKEADEAFFYLEDDVDVCLNELLDELRHLKSKVRGPVA